MTTRGERIFAETAASPIIKPPIIGTACPIVFGILIPASIKTKVMDYVAANRKTIKQDFQANANYFYDHRHNEYIVKCAVYDDEMMLLEINISVATKDQAVEVCMNWRTNVDRLYGDVIGLLFSRDKLPKSPAVAPGCQDEMSASG